MATILRLGRLRVMIYSRDHPPAHVHVIGSRGSAKIEVRGPSGHPGLVWNLGLSRRDLARALAAIEDHAELILSEWKKIHDNP